MIDPACAGPQLFSFVITFFVPFCILLTVAHIRVFTES